MPSHTPKQAKVMSAIAHGWEPSHGDVAKIPMKVAKDFHAADAGGKYGKGEHGKHRALKIAYENKRRARADGGGVFHGPIVSEVPGRTDRHNMDVAAGSYVIPAESVSHLGQNNTLAGLKHLKDIGPHGIRKLAHAAKGAHEIIRKHRLKRALGGSAGDDTGHPIGVVTAGGEHVLSPEDVKIIGDGDVTLGHRLMDNWILQNRKDHIKTLSKLDGPSKD